VNPIDPNDDADAQLDELLSRARRPEPSAGSTRRLKATWAHVSPSSALHRRRLVRTAAAVAALVLMGLSVTMIIVPRMSDTDEVVKTTESVHPPQTTTATIAETRRAPQPETIRLASIPDRDMIASDKLAIWSEVRRRAARSGRAVPTVHARPHQTASRPAPSTAPLVIDGSAESLAAIRVQLARY
jgi:hypothetical protein